MPSVKLQLKSFLGNQLQFKKQGLLTGRSRALHILAVPEREPATLGASVNQCSCSSSLIMGKVKKGVKKFQKKQASGGVHKKKKLHFRRDNARAAEAAKAVEEAEKAPNRRGIDRAFCPASRPVACDKSPDGIQQQLQLSQVVVLTQIYFAESPAKSKKVAEKLDVDDFLSGGFEQVQADSDVSSQGGDSENEDDLSEQSDPESIADDTADADAAAESTSESDGMLPHTFHLGAKLTSNSACKAQIQCMHVCKAEDSEPSTMYTTSLHNRPPVCQNYAFAMLWHQQHKRHPIC